jgi:hypothetical protein
MVIYENNSTDGTKQMLESWAKEDEKVFVTSEDVTTDFIKSITIARDMYNSPSKNEVIAWARNNLVKILEKEMFNDVTHIVLFDLNTEYPLPIQNIYNCIMKANQDYDALVCNAVNPDGTMYDVYSLRTLDHPFGPEIMGNNFWNEKHINQLGKSIGFKDEYIPIYSGFNGLCIVKRESMIGARYSGVPSAALDSFYRLNCKDIIEKAIFVINGNPLGIYCFPDFKLFYVNNAGYNYPVVNPHSTFFRDMIQNNHKKIYMYPKFFWRKYSSLLRF